MRYAFFLLWLIGTAGVKTVHAQTHTIDSLKVIVAQATDRDAKTNAWLQLCEQKYSLPADSLFQYAKAIKALNQDRKNETALVLADYYTAYSLLIYGFEDTSLLIANNYINRLQKKKDRRDLYMLFLHLRGTIFYRTNRTKDNINTYYELLNLAQQLNDTSYILIAKRGLSLAYMVNGQDREALKIFYSAIELLPKEIPEHYREVYGLLLINASISYLHLHQNTRDMIFADSCDYFGSLTIAAGKKADNLFIECQGLVVRGLILSYKNRIAEAESSLQQGLAVRKLIADTIYIISDMSVLASFYANTKQLEKGVALCHAGIALAKKRKISPALLLLLYSALAENYRSTGHYKEYADALKLQMEVKDSLNTKNSTDELKALQTRYDLQKQENIVIQQKLDITKKNYWLYGSVLFTVMGILIIWLLFRNYQRKQRARLAAALEEEKRIAAQSIIDAEEQERKRIAADLHDNLGVYAASLASNLNYLQPAETGSMGTQALTEVKNNSNAIISELNDTIWVLKKDALSLTAISDRVKVFIGRIANSYPDTSIDVREAIEKDVLLPASQAFHLYRIIQEALNNALRHSRAHHVVVEFMATPRTWSVTINDDGIGLAANPSKQGNGLSHMQERSQEAGWQIEWSPGKDGGTSVQVHATTN